MRAASQYGDAMIFAYLDAGSGSLLLQALIGGIAGLVVFFKYRWSMIREWFRKDSARAGE
jgi:hypothetical protein